MGDFLQLQAGNIIAVAFSTCLVAVYTTWTTVHDLSRDYSRIVAFMDEGDRFTRSQAEELTSYLEKDIEIMEGRIDKLENKLGNLENRYNNLIIEHRVLKGNLDARKD